MIQIYCYTLNLNRQKQIQTQTHICYLDKSGRIVFGFDSYKFAKYSIHL